MTDVEFEGVLDRVADRLAGLPTVHAVSLGGSRARGQHRPDSDIDLAIYYRGAFDPDSLERLGWPGTVSAIGGWGGGVFNGGAWLRIDGHQVDVHYRDLDSVEHQLAEAHAGRFSIEPLLFHLVGIPSYLLVAELAQHRVLRGELPRPDFPAQLRATAPPVWWDRAQRNLDYAEDTHARFGRLTECLGLVASASLSAAHAVLAARGEWVTNEKTLLERAGLRGVDRAIASVTPDTASLRAVVAQVRSLCAAAVDGAVGGEPGNGEADAAATGHDRAAGAVS
ncbi:nucleotidyltransferase domain-containing protein [Planctomonas psychrotolerans]|uniref:nucleotidyltransferase domain-containing protein n=1 Tax=Planctomonas psychrotolerans TaxID=2528712 RepID=UPI0012396478|nr:nucleotidyltransferase domain-containing protein [Planctomonas psychrotolerans]